MLGINFACTLVVAMSDKPRQAFKLSGTTIVKMVGILVNRSIGVKNM